MTYCRVSIEHTTRGCVYQKDFDPQHVFGPLVRALASELVRQGVVQEGDHYTAIITPRYEDSLQPAPVVVIDQTRAQQPRPSWFNIELQNAQVGQPLAFFTLELCFQETGLIYRQDLQIINLDYFWKNIQTALLQMHVLQNGDLYIPRVAMRDDDAADYAHEEIQVARQEDDALLIELVDDEHVEPDWPRKSPADFAADEIHEAALISPVELEAIDTEHQDDVQIFVARSTWEALQTIACRDVVAEQGGVLVGQVYRHADGGGRYLVEIVGHIVAEDANANAAEFRYNFDSWLRQSEQLKAHFPDQQIVGWYHTHLVAVALNRDKADAAQEMPTTELFFSDHDRFMHRRFFSEPWYVAMVLNPQGSAAFFRWFGGQISANRRFTVFSPGQ